MWQTGNAGSYNTYEEAKRFMLESYDNKVGEFSDGYFYSFCIMKVYSGTVR